MNKTEYQRTMKKIALHGKILIRGFAKMIYGALAASLIAMACQCFAMIPGEGGYVAVLDFVGAVVTLAVAIFAVYVMGAGRKKAH